jgi:hypothetical protein
VKHDGGFQQSSGKGEAGVKRLQIAQIDKAHQIDKAQMSCARWRGFHFFICDIAMRYLLILQLLLLLALANFSPILATRLFGNNFAQPLDAGINYYDHRPIFGASKTIRGVLVSLAVTSGCALLLGINVVVGALIAITAMTGDLISSFIKRRLALAPGAQATGLDQIPESLLPLLAVRQLFGLTMREIIATTAIFFVGAMVSSYLLFRLHLRDRPY